MKKKKSKGGSGNSAPGGRITSNVVSLFKGQGFKLHQSDPMGASWRHYPRSEARRREIDRLRQKPLAELPGDDLWRLGEYQIVEGLAEGDETLINAGTEALMAGASLTPPHPGCLLDLGWLLCYRGMDQMALFHLDRAAALVPHSRDVWTLRGWASIGVGSRERAIGSFRRAVELPQATDNDRSTLASLEAGDALSDLRKGLILRKFDDEVMHANRADARDGARSGVLQLKQLLEQKPEDVDVAYGLAYSHYILNQFNHAEPLLLRVIGTQPDHADALTLLGLISKKQEKLQEQRAYYERAVAANPDHVLANVNLASMYQDDQDFHRARPLLKRAIEAAKSGDPHLPIALDLLGNSYAAIEQDFVTEADLHRQAITLDPKRPLFRANLVVSLLSADRAKDAHRALQAAKDARLSLPNQSMIEGLVKLYQERGLDPREYMYCVDSLGGGMGWFAVKPLVRRAWERRHVVLDALDISVEEKAGFVSALGQQASRVGDKELALEVWRLGCTLPQGEAFTENLAAELSLQGRHAEALAAAAVMSMKTPRSWTILGNVRTQAGQKKAALEAYRMALDRDERFLLPLANAIHTAAEGFLAEELDPFIDRLRSDWLQLPAATCLLGKGLYLQGKLNSAAQSFEAGLWDGDRIRTPEDLWSDAQDKDDMSLLGSPDMEHHYAAAKCFLELGRLDLLSALVDQVSHWPQWMNGDWKVLAALGYLRAGQVEAAATVVADMADQPPPRLVAVEIALARGLKEEAATLTARGVADADTERFNHPKARPDALFRAFAAQHALDQGEAVRAEELAREAVCRDPACAPARLVFAQALADRDGTGEGESLLADGLRRVPGHPQMVEALIQFLVSGDRSEDALAVLEAQRPLLAERMESAMAYRLGEFIALDRLARTQRQVNVTSLSKLDSLPGWIEEMAQPLRTWLTGAWLALDKGEVMASAYAMYLSKVAEYLLFNQVIVPFRQMTSGVRGDESERHRDISRFLLGGVPPALGSMVRLLEAAGRGYRSSEDELVTKFRDGLATGQLGNPRQLRSEAMVENLLALARLRNSAAHLGEHSLDEVVAAGRCVLMQDMPGPLFEALSATSPPGLKN